MTFPTMPAEFAERYRAAGYWIGQTHSDLLDDAASRFPERTAVIDGSVRVSYRELADRVRRRANQFGQSGIAAGDRVVIQLPNSIDFVECLFGLYHLGAVPVFALTAHRFADLAYFIDHSEAVGYLHAGRVGTADFDSIAARLREDRPGLVAMNVRTATPAAEPPAASRHRADPAGLAFLQLSGGTTGKPKLIPRTHDDYLYSVRASAEICGLTPDAVMLVVLPIAHNFTMSSPGILGALSVGAAIVMSPDASPDTGFRLVAEHRVTHVALVPPLLIVWLNAANRPTRTTLQTLWVGGAKLSEEIARRVPLELGCGLQQVFGMAEGLVCYTRIGDGADIVATTQGRPISPADEIKVLDDAGQEVPPGAAGHLLTRGPYTIRGYYRAPEQNSVSFDADGFYRTGDIVRVDDGGNLTVVGRAKDQINRGGEKIAPEALENHLLAHPAIHDVSVVGVPDPELGERVQANVIVRPGLDRPTVLALRTFLLKERGAATYLVPDLVQFVSEFPKTGVGKVNKGAQRTD